jgi:hypothetical protein
MHLVFLGAVRQMVHHLVSKGRLTEPYAVRLTNEQRIQVSDRLRRYNGKIPSDFTRQPRGVEDVKFWKATEFRQFLLYTGIIVLHGIVSDELYSHFLLLSVGIALLMEEDAETRNANLPRARQMLQAFSSGCHAIYGPKYTVYNIHSVQHLPDDVQHFGQSLSEITAFPFENHLAKIKKMVRGPTSLIAQVYRRLAEQDRIEQVQSGHPKMKITRQLRDSCFLTKEKDYVFVQRDRRVGWYDCQILSRDDVAPLFEEPCNSKTLLNMGVAMEYRRHLRGDANGVDYVMHHRQFDRKVVCLPHLTNQDSVYLIPMLHEAETAINQ